jgi:hypothetical protein
MHKFYTMKYWGLIVISVLVTTILTGMGMGVPILNILFGFIIGWYTAKRACILYEDLGQRLSKILIYCIFCSGITLVLMLCIWGSTIHMLFNPLSDYKNFGIPMILYDPKQSFIGWLVLMIIISPFLQLLSSIFSAFITLKVRLKSSGSL